MPLVWINFNWQRLSAQSVKEAREVEVLPWGRLAASIFKFGGKMHTKKFTHEDMEHEVRVICDGESVYVKVFQDNRQSNRFRYSATMEVIQDKATVAGTDAVKYLIEIAKQDVINGLK